MSKPSKEFISPKTLIAPGPARYSHIAKVHHGTIVYLSGQVPSDASGNVVGEGDFDAQCLQVFKNIEAALASVGGNWENIVQFTTYLVHSQDIPKFMEFRKRHFPGYFANGVYPPNTLLMIDRLVQEPFLVEVQTIAAL